MFPVHFQYKTYSRTGVLCLFYRNCTFYHSVQSMHNLQMASFITNLLMIPQTQQVLYILYGEWKTAFQYQCYVFGNCYYFWQQFLCDAILRGILQAIFLNLFSQYSTMHYYYYYAIYFRKNNCHNGFLFYIVHMHVFQVIVIQLVITCIQMFIKEYS